MDRAVETIIRENKGKIRPGDVYLHQRALQRRHPHPRSHRLHAGVRPRAERKILFWVASRGHHADIGGIAPGSMSPLATSIEEEGIYIDNFKLVDRGKFREAALYDLLTKAQYPARNPLQNVNDLKAQIAANEKGVQELHKMVAQFGLPVVHAYMSHVQDNADESVRRVIDRAARLRIQLRGGPGQRHRGEDHGRQEEARGDRRFHRHLAAAGHATSTRPSR